jgi:photosynthetic reaction center cytochrome c subunit
MKNKTFALAAIGVSLFLAGCELGPKATEQTGPRGSGMNQIVDKDLIKPAAYIPPPPYPLEPDNGGPRAGQTYQNLKVLGDLSTDEFNRLMLSLNDWVVPKNASEERAGCNYCHNPENMASDEIYTKGVARQMLVMTRNINANWKSHVQNTGVTCYTCHRGNAIPQYYWSNLKPQPASIRGNKHNQNTPDKAVGYASLPSNIYEPYFARAVDIRVGSTDAYRVTPTGAPIRNAEHTYGLMMRFSSALGVNCTYCHNSNNFGDWKSSRPQRVTAWYGIRMVRQANNEHITKIASLFPANRLGSQGDPFKINCMTCHQGVNKPLGGVSMLKDHPALAGPRGPVAVQTPGPAVAPPAMKPVASLVSPEKVARP